MNQSSDVSGMSGEVLWIERDDLLMKRRDQEAGLCELPLRLKCSTAQVTE